MSFGEYFGAFSSLGGNFLAQQEADEQKRYQKDAADLAGKQLDVYLGQSGGLGALGQAPGAPAGGLSALGTPSTPKLPSFAGGAAPMTLPTGDGKEIETKFVGALKDGGLTNPFGLAAAAAYAQRESRYNPKNIVGSWSDPSESGQAGQSGGILSWRADRLNNMRAFTAGAKDPVTAQAKFFLTEDPNTTLALQNAKSPEEANDILAKAWKFAGYNRPGGGEYAARLGTTRAYVNRLAGMNDAPATPPVQVASATPNGQLPPGASGLNPAFRPPQRPVQVAENEADVQRLEQGMMPGQPAPAPAGPPKVLIPQSMAGMGIPGTIMDRGNPVAQVAAPGAPPTPIPAPPRQVASADEADLPAPNAQPAEFRIPPGGQAQPQMPSLGAPSGFVPGQQVSPAIQSNRPQEVAPIQGQPRMSPQQAQFLRAQLANPLTRAQAIQTIQGLGAPDKWEIKELNGQVVQTNARGDVRRVPGFDKPDELEFQVGKDGARYVNNKRTGASYQLGAAPPEKAETNDIANYNFAVANGYQGQFNDWLTNVKRAGASSVSIDQKGETAFSTTANTGIAKRFEDLSKEGDAARTDSALLGQLRDLGNVTSTGALAAAQGYLSSKGINLGENVGAVQAYQAIVDKLVPAQRIPGSGTTSDFDAKGFKNALAGLSKTPEGNQLIIGTLTALNEDKMARASIAERALVQEISPKEAIQQLRALPPPNLAFKSGLAELAKSGKFGSAAADSPVAGRAQPALDQGEVRLKPAPPAAVNDARAKMREGYTADQIREAFRKKGFTAPADL